MESPEAFGSFGCLNYELLLAKLKEYDLDNNSVTFMRSNLTKIFQHSEIFFF